jgi:hypothetical protein
VTETKTKTRGPQFALPDDPPEDHLPEPIALTPEQIAAQKEAIEQDRLRQVEWAAINQALSDNAMAVTRAMSRRYSGPGERETQTEQALASYDEGSFLIDRLGAEAVLDQDLAAVLLQYRRGLIDEYGSTPAAMMLIDRAVAAYQDFIRIEGWAGNLSIHIEHEFFGRHGPSAEFRDRYGRGGGTIRGLSVEEHLAHLRESLLPLAERYGRVMCEALAALEMLRSVPSEAVERSRPMPISVLLGKSC